MRVCVLTTGRQDWGILTWVARAIVESPRLTLVLVAGGMHFRDGAGPRVLDGLPVDDVVDSLQASDSPRAVAQSAGWTTALLAPVLARQDVELLVLAGDRTETLAAAVAATCMRVPILHLHGGEESLGAIDNACRHAITRLAQYHAVAHERFASRLEGWGERPDRVYVTGAPGLDVTRCLTPLDPAALARSLGRDRLGTPLVILTHHPTTLGEESPASEIAAVLEGVRRAVAGRPDALVVMTAANADTGGGTINTALRSAAAADPHRFLLVESLGAQRYHSLLALADVMVGNSSSGILEAPTYDLPVVNVGDRQRGRLRVGRVTDVPVDAEAVERAVRAETAAAGAGEPRAPRPARTTPYGDGRAAPRLLAVLHAIADEPAPRRLVKEHAPAPLDAQG